MSKCHQNYSCDNYVDNQRVMHALPKWFSPPDDIDKKSVIHRDFPFFAAYVDEEPVGFIALKIHNQYTADIFTIGVVEKHHRKGIGRNLLKVAEKFCIDNGYIYLTVKTLDGSVHYEPYDGTRAFYMKMNFIPLEVFPTFWNKENPCLFLVKRLGD